MHEEYIQARNAFTEAYKEFNLANDRLSKAITPEEKVEAMTELTKANERFNNAYKSYVAVKDKE